MSRLREWVLLAGSSNPALAAKISGHLGRPLGKVEIRRFSDGEIFVEIGENVRGRAVYLIQSTCAPANETMMELLIIMDALKRVESGISVPDICRELGISTATFYKWRAKFGGMDTSMISKMKELEEENRRLRRMYVEEKLKAEIVAEALAKKW